MKLILANYFVSDQKGEESHFSQMSGANSASLEFQVTYWECLTLYYWSARAFHADAPLFFFTNREPLNHFRRFISTWQRWQVDVQVVPFAYRPPRSLASTFGNSFYLLDVLRAASQISSADDTTWVFSDPDCIFRASISSFLRQEDMDVIFGLPIDYKEDYPANGLSRRQLAAIAQEEGYSLKPGVPIWYGGEFLALSSSALRQVLPVILQMQEKNALRWTTEKASFRTEEQLLSAIFAIEGIPMCSADEFAARLWTGSKFRNVTGNEEKLALWHLPAEKRFGLKRLFKWLQKREFEHSPAIADEFLERARKECGVPTVSIQKFFQDLTSKVSLKAKEWAPTSKTSS